jgi:hypothetical protein
MKLKVAVGDYSNLQLSRHEPRLFPFSKFAEGEAPLSVGDM